MLSRLKDDSPNFQVTTLPCVSKTPTNFEPPNKNLVVVESSNVLVASPRHDLQSGVVPSGNGTKKSLRQIHLNRTGKPRKTTFLWIAFFVNGQYKSVWVIGLNSLFCVNSVWKKKGGWFWFPPHWEPFEFNNDKCSMAHGFSLMASGFF